VVIRSGDRQPRERKVEEGSPSLRSEIPVQVVRAAGFPAGRIGWIRWCNGVLWIAHYGGTHVLDVAADDCRIDVVTRDLRMLREQPHSGALSAPMILRSSHMVVRARVVEKAIDDRLCHGTNDECPVHLSPDPGRPTDKPCTLCGND